MKYKLKDIKTAFSRTLNFLPQDLTDLWNDFEINLGKVQHENNVDKVMKEYGKKETRRPRRTDAASNTSQYVDYR